MTVRELVEYFNKLDEKYRDCEVVYKDYRGKDRLIDIIILNEYIDEAVIVLSED